MLVPDGATNPEYLYYALSTTSSSLASFGQGSTFTDLSRTLLAAFRLPLPPLAEQLAIVEFLEKATSDLDAAIARAGRQVELLQEHRIRLIADVVPGKLDLGEAALEMPEEPAREASMDTNGPMADNERAGLKPVPTSTAYVWYDSNRQPEER